MPETRQQRRRAARAAERSPSLVQRAEIAAKKQKERAEALMRRFGL